MKRKVFLMGVLALAVARFSLAQLSPGEYGREFTSSDDGTTQPYRLYVPAAINETSQALPLVVVLHGWGVDEFAWFKFTPVRRVADEFGFVVAAPYARGNWWYRGSAERDVLDMIRDVRKALRIDPRRIYLAGHSMGGWGTWYIGLRHPELFAAIAPMAGFDPAELVVAAANLSPFV
ncbi:MAG: alpha/beta fold hydrolase, partial [Candidatus Sumerlaeaceae bacterium]